VHELAVAIGGAAVELMIDSILCHDR